MGGDEVIFLCVNFYIVGAGSKYPLIGHRQQL